MGRKKITILICCLCFGLLGLCSCGSFSLDLVESVKSKTENEVLSETSQEHSDEEVNKLIYERSMELAYAQNFSVDYYQGGYKLLTLKDDTKYLLVPEGKVVPSGLADDVVVLQKPLKNVYLVASSAMNMFAELDAMDCITLSGQKEDGWYIEEAKEAMQKGQMVYAGKYNKPDYELILSYDCSLAIENMMISHSPEVIEKLEDFGIPVMIEYSSYESHPMARVEWVKFFGALTDKEGEAEEIFSKQLEVLEQVTSNEKTDQTVAFFFVTSNGLVQVRNSNDYVPKMIELAGGKYIFENIGDSDSSRSTLNMQIEEFYKGAKDADYLIYNSSIDGGVSSMEALLDKCEVLKDFKAVKEGNVWCTTNDMYQQSMSIGYLIKDIHKMIAGEEDGMVYLFKLE